VAGKLRTWSCTFAAVLLCGGVLGIVGFPSAAVAATPSWSIVSSPSTSATQTDYLDQVSCASATACTAVGYYSSPFQTLIEQWNGTSWSIVPSPNATTTQDNWLYGVSCTSASACTAVGFYTNGSFSQETLIEQWNGSSWSIVPSPNTSAPQDNFLEGVSCTSASACTAVGYYTNGGSYDQTLVEQWNGTTWSIVPSPNPSVTQDSQLNGVSCTSASSCTAVGYAYSGSSFQTLIEQWNGTAWSIVTSPNATTTQDNGLYGVSCISASACTAVGNYLTGTNDQTLIEQWNGTAWSLVSSPNSSTTQHNFLNGVSCTSASACTAAGDYLSGSYVQTLIEQWNGTAWSIASSPNTSATQSNELGGVSCTPGLACTAVGEYDTGTNYQTLIEMLPPSPGYDLAGSDGGVFVFPVGQSSGFFGSLPGLGVHVHNIVGIVPTDNFTGYDLVGSDGGVFVFPVGQSSGFFGSLPGLGVRVSNIVGIVPTKDYTGYDLVGSDGGVFVFPVGQSSGYYGSLPGKGIHVSDIVGIVASPGGGGYFLVGRDGGVFTFGNAPFFGSLPGIGVSVDDITGIAATPDGKGYYVVGANGAVYAFGDAHSHGSLPGIGVTVSNIVSIVPTPDGGGYWLIGSDGGVFAFGDASSQGSLPGLKVSVSNIVGAVPTG
jgi:hypothetical protein